MKIHKHLVDQVATALADIFSSTQYADKVIEKKIKANPKWGSRDRKFFAESVYEMVRWWRLLWHFVGKDPSMQKPDLIRLWGFYQNWKGHPLPDWPEFNGYGSPNFSLKELPRAVRESIPNWLDELGVTEFGARWDSLLSALNEQAPVYLRVNTLKTTSEKLISLMQQEDVEVEKVPKVSTALKLKVRKNVFITKAFKNGFFEVQDAASQLIAPFMELEPGLRVVDACAGAGGKTLHMASILKNKGKIIALDIHEWKLGELKKRAARNGVDVIETRVIEGSKTIKRLEESCDRLLLDVPCSGLGVLRRNPDAKWKLSREEIERIRIEQQKILEDYSSMVKKGGKLVYSTCSILPSENRKQVDLFLQNHPQWTFVDEINVFPDKDGFDGFYAAKLVRG